MRFPPANLQLRRAQLVLMMATLFPTIALCGVGIVLLAFTVHNVTNILLGGLVLALCTSGITGYILGSIFVGKGASLARLQNDFVSSVSHELRTPLTSIQLFIESLRGNRLDPEEREQVLELLGREAYRLNKLVDRVLDLSKLESASHVWRKEPIDVAELVDEALAVTRVYMLDHPTPIGREVEPNLMVTGDRPALVRALSNLTNNAWKYTGADKNITIRACSAGRWVELHVLDNGMGFDPTERVEVIEQFSRGKAARESGAPGYGLGLAFVRAIVRGHKGKLEIVSQPGKTDVCIKVRRRRDPAGEVATTGSVAGAAAGAKATA